MTRLRGALIAILLLVLPAAAQDMPAYSNVYVNDFADVLSDETEATLTQMIEAARAARDHEMTVVTIKSVDDYTPGLTIERFSKVLFNTWGVGNAERNDGIMLVVAVEDREMRIALGSGFRARFDGIAARIIDSIIVPEFRAGRMESGVISGVEASLERLRLEAELPPQGLMERFSEFTDRYPAFGITAAIIGVLSFPLVFFLAPFAAFFGIRGLLRRRPRKCPECGRIMLRLGEAQEDQYLDPGQVLEEQIKSKDYGVWFCTHDEHVTIVSYSTWRKKHKACPECSYHTLETKRDVLEPATTTRAGRAMFYNNCVKCGHTASHEGIIPMRPKTSSSRSGGGGGSSGGSFGGGSSSGGGASGSW